MNPIVCKSGCTTRRISAGAWRLGTLTCLAALLIQCGWPLVRLTHQRIEERAQQQYAAWVSRHATAAAGQPRGGELPTWPRHDESQCTLCQSLMGLRSFTASVPASVVVISTPWICRPTCYAAPAKPEFARHEAVPRGPPYDC